MNDVPELLTPRVRLRGPIGEDFDGAAALWGDPSVVAMISGVPDTPGQAWERLLSHVGHWAVRGYGFWTVEDRATGQFLGQAGFYDRKRGIAPVFEGMPEAGWAFAPHAQGRGIATEAMRAALVWGDNHLPHDRSYALIHPAHEVSIRVSKKLGYGVETRCPWKGGEALVMQRVRS